ncbi:TIM23 complex component [Gnomoniopsis smithogilvyi]|uniref:Presequence translocated-associated motor subunit PAM17 n=1 Tax=Gnomoniopsis smithogilvyi TaxID=1191159 RepID=A0A9W8YYX6_9PEZI|nr:TIM23 complex component [Gnomoniopsis smithogilvyi]
MLTVTTTTMLRTGVTRSCALQPVSLLRATTGTCSYSTVPAPASPFSVRCSKLLPSTTTKATSFLSPAITRTTKPSSILALRAQHHSRHASTDANRDANAAARAAAKAIASDPNSPPLDWNTFFQLRKTRRRWQVAFSLVMSLASGTGAAIILSTGVADSITSEVPLDPVLTLGLVTLGFIALGWLVGPSLGNALFYLVKSKYKAPMTVKESQFFARIKKNRVDPSNDSTGNPVPDFYGEKISSVAGYRQWLKDQRAYNKKRTTFI